MQQAPWMWQEPHAQQGAWAQQAQAAAVKSLVAQQAVCGVVLQPLALQALQRGADRGQAGVPALQEVAGAALEAAAWQQVGPLQEVDG